jgi:hypothetical protein
MKPNQSSSSLRIRSDKPIVNDGNSISKYIKNVSIMNRATAYAYLRRLASFRTFISNAFNLTVDEHIKRIREGNEDDAIAHLSDQLIAITGRLQELERSQITA